MEGRPWRDFDEVVKIVGEAKAARRLRVGERLRPGRVAENGRGAGETCQISVYMR